MLVLHNAMFGDRRHFGELPAGCEERIATNAPRASEQLRAAYDAALRDDTGKPPASPPP
jgi:hypothetical protein